MKNKKVKKVVNSKNNYFKYATMVLLVAFAAVGVSKILGFEINKDTRICEDKKGNLFVPRDKNGIIDECNKHAEAVTFNFDGGSGSGGGNIVGDGTGYVRFVDGLSVLTEDGVVWRYQGNIFPLKPWIELNKITRINSDIVDSIINWSLNGFLTNTNYYVLKNDNINIEYSEYVPVSFPVKPTI